MERLTKRGVCVQGVEKVGCTHFDSYTCCQFEGQCSDGCPYEEQAWERLADYEDTGMNPHTARVLADFVQRHTIADIDHLNRLAEAEKDGRLVVLPCKFGDSLYRIRRFKRGSNWKKEAVHIMSTTLTINNVANVLFGDVLGKTVFLTHEEAEKALKEDA